MAISRVRAIKTYFSTQERPVTAKELLEFAKKDKVGFDELARGAAKELGETLETEEIKE